MTPNQKSFGCRINKVDIALIKPYKVVFKGGRESKRIGFVRVFGFVPALDMGGVTSSNLVQSTNFKGFSGSTIC